MHLMLQLHAYSQAAFRVLSVNDKLAVTPGYTEKIGVWPAFALPLQKPGVKLLNHPSLITRWVRS
jgi:hypothetical protein